MYGADLITLLHHVVNVLGNAVGYFGFGVW